MNNNPQKPSEKNNYLKIAIIAIALLVICYVAFKLLTATKTQEAKEVETTQFDSEIFDINDEYKASESDLAELTVSQMREKGADFIYQMLLKNQLQIESLKGDVRDLQNEVRKYKSHEKIGKMILSYVKLRDRIFAGEDYSKELSTFDLLSLNDKTLNKLSLALGEKLKNFSSNEKLRQEFSVLSPELIAIKNHGNSDEFFPKMMRNISKIITIRRTDKVDGNDVDAVIFRIEKSLKEKDYSKALADLNSLEEKYRDVSMPFVSSLESRIDIEKLDQKITSHLEQLI
jgi:hypothetical protein